jgi:hypothetical protein
VFHLDVSFFFYPYLVWMCFFFLVHPCSQGCFFLLKTKFCSFIIEFRVIEFALQSLHFKIEFCISISTFSNITKRNTNSIHFKLQQQFLLFIYTQL